ncbi:MAG: S9 family peptidase [Candidatus Tectomicrobia bacterium]|nr:S9 family peptidase [Candidatus Tectomicrobia bacterium]
MSPKRTLAPEDLLKIDIITDARISPDGQTVAYAVQSADLDQNEYRSAIWLVPTEGGSPRRFTFGPKQDSSPRWSPDGRRLAFISDRSGQKQIWVIEADGGEASRLTDLPQGVAEPSWSPDGQRIAFLVTDTKDESAQKDPKNAPIQVIDRLRYRFDGRGYINGRYQHIWTIDAKGGQPKQLTFGEQDDLMPAWSPDGDEIAFVSNRADEKAIFSHSDLWVVSSEGGDSRRLTSTTEVALAPSWSPDGTQIAYIGHAAGSVSGVNNRLWLVSREGENSRNLTTGFDRSVGTGVFSDTWSATALALPYWLPDGQSCVFQAADRGQVGLFRVDMNGEVTRIIGGDRECGYLSVAANGKRVAFIVSDWTHPMDLCVADIDGSHERRLTDLNPWLEDEFDLATPQHIAFKSFDGLEIDGWLIRPLNPPRETSTPLILNIHGGPHSIFGHTFFFDTQFLVHHGYAVLMLNPRASQGYGEEFSTCNLGDWGGGDYQDLMYGVDHVLRLGGIDSERLGVTGLSYGGYMTNWIIGHTNRFKAAVSENSSSNRLSMHGTSDIGWYSGVAEFQVSPWDDMEKWIRQSPITYAREIKTPTLFLNGEADYRCPIEQAEQLFTALKVFGCEAEMVRFPGESHVMLSIGRPRSRLERRRHLLRWFDKYLRD